MVDLADFKAYVRAQYDFEDSLTTLKAASKKMSNTRVNRKYISHELIRTMDHGAERERMIECDVIHILPDINAYFEAKAAYEVADAEMKRLAAVRKTAADKCGLPTELLRHLFNN